MLAQMQEVEEDRAIRRFVEFPAAFEAGIARRNELVELMCGGDESGR